MNRYFPWQAGAAAALLTALTAAGCSNWNNQDKTPGASPAGPSASQPATRPSPASPGQAVIYVVNPDAKGADDPLMPRTISLGQSDTPARSALEALLHDPHSPIAPGTALRGMSLRDGLATLDFSRSPVNETGGEGGQSDALTAIGRTLGQFPEVRQFQIEVRGTPVKAFGEFTADGPVEVTRPEAKS